MVMSVPNVSSMASVHDFHKFAIHHNGVAPALHFHLAASVNPETGMLSVRAILLLSHLSYGKYIDIFR